MNPQIKELAEKHFPFESMGYCPCVEALTELQQEHEQVLAEKDREIARLKAEVLYTEHHAKEWKDDAMKTGAKLATLTAQNEDMRTALIECGRLADEQLDTAGLWFQMQHIHRVATEAIARIAQPEKKL